VDGEGRPNGMTPMDFAPVDPVDPVAADVAERADAAFVTHVTWALERTPGMSCRVTPELVLADSDLACDTFNFICRSRLTPAAAERARHRPEVRRWHR